MKLAVYSFKSVMGEGVPIGDPNLRPNNARLQNVLCVWCFSNKYLIMLCVRVSIPHSVVTGGEVGSILKRKLSPKNASYDFF